MTELIVGIIVAIVSAFLGYIISIWQYRSRPWITSLYVDDRVNRTEDEVIIDPDLSQDIKKTISISYFVHPYKNNVSIIVTAQ